MIKFFGTIRQGLMAENKFTKYLAYAFGEIILVVIGILLALNINNWNEANKLRNKQTELLMDIHHQLANDTLYFVRLIDRLEGSNASIRILHSLPPYHDSLAVYFAGVRKGIWFQHSSAPFEQLKSTGFDLIRNTELKHRLISLYDFHIPRNRALIKMELETFIEQMLLPFYYEHMCALEKDSTLSDHYWIPKDYESLIKNPDYMTILLGKKKVNDREIGRLKNTVDAAKGVLEELEKELGL